MTGNIQLTPEQQAATHSLNRDCIVSAGAGSGKTRVLVERYLKILAEHRFNTDLLDQVVAITFTEKAATEMKERVRRGMEERLMKARLAGNVEEADGWYRLLTEIERACITTIHSFCRSILKKFPIEAGVDPEFRVLEEFEARWLLKEAVEQTLSSFLDLSPGGREARVFERWLVGVGIQAAERQFMSAVLECFTHGWSPDELKRVTTWHLNQAEEELETKRKNEFGRWEGQLLASAERLLALKKLKRAEEFRAKWSDIRGIWKKAAGDPEKLKMIHSLQESLAGRWGSKEEVKQPLEECREACEQLAGIIHEQLYLPDEKELTAVICDLIARIIERYNRLKQERAGVDFDEMQSRVCSLLSEHPEIRAEMRKKIRYLMVDEYQDTNDLQKRLIDLLINDEQGNHTPGTWFVVGDPKQSIYRFRGADVSLFHRTRMEILASGGQEVALTANFRSHPELISFYNHFFGRLMAKEKESPNYYQPVQSREDQTRPEVVVEYLAVPHKKEDLPPGWDRRDAEAQMVAKHIAGMMEAGTPARDIALLFRAMTHVKKYERELAKWNIPFHIVKGRGFYDRQEIADLLHFLRVLVEPENRLALAGVLRSPFCGISDETLLRISLENQWQVSAKDWAELPGLPEEERSKLYQFHHLWTRAGEWVGALKVADLMERMLEESGYRYLMWAAPEGKQAVANLKKLIRQARSMRGLAAYSVPEYLERMDLLMRDQQAETEASVESEHSDSVKLMTIHQSKGLEFPVVYVADLSYANTERHGAVRIDAEAGLVVVMKDERGESVELSRWKQAVERNRRLEWEESVRLLYVACTRAESRLVLCGAVEPLKEGKSIREVTKWSQWLDGILDYRKIDWEERRWSFSEHCLPIRVHADLAEDEIPTDSMETPLDRYLAGELATERGEGGKEPLEFLKPRGYTEHDLLEISVTDWKKLVNCPRKYFYQHVLGLPQLTEEEPEDRGYAGMPVLSPTVKGRVVHRLIELLSKPENRTFSWEKIAQNVWNEFSLPRSVQKAAEAEVRPYIGNFLNSRVYAGINREEPRTEQEFAVNLGGLQVIGVIDCLLPHPNGTWEIIDYKTDQISVSEVEEAAMEYKPQLELYVLSAKRMWNLIPEKATLYFLKPDREYTFTVTDKWLRDAEEEVGKSIRLLRTSAGPTEPWEARPGKRCGYCEYRIICDAVREP
ncbi:UvrD-helicase domain-containing protein [Lihuaxuella thermophila]|uniref:DNA 3'-5' helicase n=1 Tax=Lihuaxuella thermophila TaxID=1173111 RepID=A0A1H8AQD6_9BACL|nr:UvrD-helicase domain-containing protein [Lihuaxuella thermophila]SEM72773.1 ATP-dependent helicase/nuclease subunit A [Lihuaxuella thermophila]